MTKAWSEMAHIEREQYNREVNMNEFSNEGVEAIFYVANPEVAFEDAKLAGFDGPGWYFWDEMSTHVLGPYATKELCMDAYARYMP